LRTDVRERGWSTKLNSYTAAYGSDDLDASLLLLAQSELEERGSPRVTATIDAVRQRLGAGGVLLYRNLAGEGQAPQDGAFLACSFWLIDALARSGRLDEAERLMSEAISLGGELGLLAEEVEPSTGEMVGNFPQALSHSTLVAAALSIEAARASGSRPESRRTPREPAG
jgi:pentatricopeptide repeat protein